MTEYSLVRRVGKSAAGTLRAETHKHCSEIHFLQPCVWGKCIYECLHGCTGEVVEYCDYKGDQLQEMLRDWLMHGVNHEAIQRCLLSEEVLTYEKALEIATAMEAAE